MAQHAYSPAESGQSPRAWYQAALARDGFIHDPAQAAAIERLTDLWQRLLEFKARRDRFLGRSLRNPPVPKGLYLWGGVGRGKSFLMDAFFQCVPYRRKRRVHFHHFMAEVHRQLQTLTQETDPLLIVADRIAKTTRLLCFDEFHVSDIADAMILYRLLSAMFERGVVLVATSNYPPSGLYPNGLQRDRFLPAIALMESQLEVITVDGGNDYRLRELARADLFQVPADAAAEASMDAMFSRLTLEATPLANDIELFGRHIPLRRHAPGVIWFDFAALCGGPRSQTDYLEIARDYHTVFLSGIPALSAAQAAEARRFTWLIDVLYDHRVKLVASSAVPAEQIYVDGVQASEFFRTASRLTEMQTDSYLALPHLVDEFQLDPSRSVAL
ncbi:MULTISPECIES: cell division protein ZapE [unclassified Paludibacterium]|uniref:cell division protein ZapE n=1 Tax=unclassified Paludibacterium TaxID=2618429 RepID=UPI001C03E9BA|nr:cell division protein ZapE [Paludibacterium sp. B53371]BEV71825.1 cell division protein ZapE [Paludibacterium sp. THUN1379]